MFIDFSMVLYGRVLSQYKMKLEMKNGAGAYLLWMGSDT